MCANEFALFPSNTFHYFIMARCLLCVIVSIVATNQMVLLCHIMHASFIVHVCFVPDLFFVSFSWFIIHCVLWFVLVCVASSKLHYPSGVS